MLRILTCDIRVKSHNIYKTLAEPQDNLKGAMNQRLKKKDAHIFFFHLPIKK